MKLTFLGATHEVTGSCYYLEACGKRILIDCGMEQGPDCFVNQPIPVTAADIDIILLTHAHVDHSGRLPLMAKEGFTGQVFATEGTAALSEIMLLDAAHIQESEAEWKNRKGLRAGEEPVEPLYDTEDAQNILRCFIGVPYHTEKYIADGIRIRFVDAGHLLGSASIEIWINESGVSKKIVFSGDIGNHGQPILVDPTAPEGADYVVMESTYGDRLHERPTDYVTALAGVLQETFARGGNVVVPSFAVGRTQELLYFFREIKERKLVPGFQNFEVYVDSPLAIEATNVFQKRMFFDFDEEATDLLNRGVNPIGFDGLKVSVTSDDSKQINDKKEPIVILSASGMCEAGRIRHHLKHNLWRPESTILFVGYQAVGTLGRYLIEGAKKVKLFNEEIQVCAHIVQLPGISGHADQSGLLEWIRSVSSSQRTDLQDAEPRSGRPQMVFITHGDDEVCDSFAALVRDELGVQTCAPYSGTVFDLATGEMVYEAQPQPIEREGAAGERERARAASEGGVAGAGAAGTGAGDADGKSKKKERDYDKKNRSRREYQLLERTANELLALVQKRSGMSNRDLEKFARDIRKVCEKWE